MSQSRTSCNAQCDLCHRLTELDTSCTCNEQPGQLDNLDSLQMNATTTTYLILVGLSSPLLLHCLNLFLFCSFHLLRYRTFPFRCCGRSISSSLHTIPVEVPMRIVADGADGCWWWVHGGLRWTWNACRRGFWKNAPNTLRHTFPSNNLVRLPLLCL